MTDVLTIQEELRGGPSDEYVYTDEAIHIVAIHSGWGTAEMTHLTISPEFRQQGLGTIAVQSLVEVLNSVERYDYDYLDAEVGSVIEPDDGSRPPPDDPTAQFLRSVGFRNVKPEKSARSKSEWVFTGEKYLG